MQVSLKYMFLFTNCLYFLIGNVHIYSLISLKIPLLFVSFINHSFSYGH